jgi:alpha-1,2-mannosyltransferase
VLAGNDIYEAHNIRDWYFIYPPLYAIFAVPLAVLPVFWAVLLWYCFSVALVVLAVEMSVQLARQYVGTRVAPGWLYVVPPLLLLWPLMSALARGQATPLLLALVIAGVHQEWKGRVVVGAVCLAGGILLKVIPAVLLAYYVWRKRWSFLGLTLLAVVLGVFVLPVAVFGWQGNLGYLKKWIKVVAQPSLQAAEAGQDSAAHGQWLSRSIVRNQSLQSVLWRMSGGLRVRELSVGIGGAMALAIVLVGWRLSGANEVLIVSAAVAWMLLVPPVSWSHYFMLLLLPLTALVGVAVGEPHPAVCRVAQIALAVFGALALLGAVSKSLQFYGPLCWGTLGLWGALLFAAWKKSLTPQAT